MSRWLVVFFSMVAVFHVQSTEAASRQEIDALRLAASQLGIQSGTWNFSTDPCVDGWRGVGCCTNDSASCCTAKYPPDLPCSRSTDAQVWTLALRSDNFGQVLNGTFPEVLCNLSSLRVLDLGVHRLRGQVPSCIGNSLSNLQVLRIGDNNFNGSIPEELGNLSNLLELYLDSTNISGTIPSSLGKLSSLRNLFLRSNALEGPIPSELGQLGSLVQLQLQVNKLTGGIPQSFASLTGLQILRLFNNELSGDIGASPFQNMNSLLEISLRSNGFTGRIPDLDTLPITRLDLSFNRFSGDIPASLGNIASLQDLFLDHNGLNGSVPESFTSLPALRYLDLSHNMLVGSLQGLGTLGATSQRGPPQVDVSFNFLNISSAPPAIIPQRSNDPNAYFNCFPAGTCSRSSPGGRLFVAVNAGGNALRSTSSSSNRLELPFDSDSATVPNNQSVGFFYGAAGTWALELSGTEAGIFTDDSSINMAGAGNSEKELYRSMRWSTSYIAYHVNGLKTGNYVVTLHFAELVFRDPGYRMFDVIVQGQVVKKSLDIVREAGAKAAYKIDRNISVANGSVSIELVRSRPDRFLPAIWQVQSMGPIVSALSIVSMDYRGDSNGSSLSAGQIAGISVGSAVFLVLLAVVFATCLVARGKKHQPVEASSQAGHVTQSEVSFDIAGTFTYQELYDATNAFTDKLGEGGFGAVYKGTLPSGIVVAVKQLLKSNEQIEDDFKKEISIISKVRHRNLLAVIGYSLESDVPMLVCEYIPNGSLDRWLFRRSDKFLSWEMRRKIAIGVACGLAYLHDESKCRIVHCDVKPANILLDADFNPRLADFGLARLYDEQLSHVTATRLKGTAGYLAPEYAMHLQLSDKVDVYSFGVVLLELLSGRHAVEFAAPSEQVVLVDWAHKEAQVPSSMLEIIDDRLQGQYVEHEARDMTTIAILCTQRKPLLRPKMQNVWLMLNGTIRIPDFLEDLNAVLHSGTSGESSSSSFTRNIAEGSNSTSSGFRSLRVFRGSSLDSSDSRPATY